MTPEATSIAKGHMPRQQTWLERALWMLLPVLLVSTISFNVYLTKQLQILDKRVQSQEDWRKDHMDRVPELLAQIAREREQGMSQMREIILREVEGKAAGQRENILNLLSNLQLSMTRIEVKLALMQGNTTP